MEGGWRTNEITMPFECGVWRNIMKGWDAFNTRIVFKVGKGAGFVFGGKSGVKRSRYDLEEEMRNNQSRGNESSTFRTHTDFNNYPFERSRSRGQWEDVWRAYKSTQSREPDRNRAN
ncbi:hypothetical protein H5410_057771, partial [Solanum commersonii]